MDFVVWYLPVAPFLLNTVGPCSESPWVLRKRKSYSGGLASPLSVFYSQKILQCVPPHVLQPQPSWPSAQSATACCDYQHLASPSTGCEGCLLFVSCQKSICICNFMNILKIGHGKKWSRLSHASGCLCTYTPLCDDTQLLAAAWAVLYFIFFPLMLFKLKQTLILCILETALFFFCNAEEGKWPGKDSLSVAVLGGNVWIKSLTVCV